MENRRKELLEFIYNFIQDNGSKKEFHIKLHPRTLELIHEPHGKLPTWTNLEFNQCSNCPLIKEEHEYCPVAANIVQITEFFKESSSFEEVDIQLDTEEREYSKRTSMQKGVSSMLGIIMVTSGCPILNKLKPMVRFHLPFANIEETIYRAVSMYLVKQYFRKRKGLEPDWELHSLMDNYKEIHIVNQAFYKRLSFMKGKDANVNALIILDNFANYINFTLDSNKLSKIEWMFEDLDN
ncbi:MAG: hypothetical protein ISS80_01170 [Candidatus Cloacimonetes bacterium]|nr:hypothetical protein [Candidatus Cloacimonadota bacterium]